LKELVIPEGCYDDILPVSYQSSLDKNGVKNGDFFSRKGDKLEKCSMKCK
jgi:hypothetical protein